MNTNTIEIRVYGLMRSGNHAIIEWIQNQFPDQPKCFLNNVKHGNFSPFNNYSQKVVSKIDSHIDDETLRKVSKHLLIYSYEDRNHLEIQNIDFLSSVFQPDFEKNRERFLGKSEYRFDVAIIRDPFNCFASRMVAISKRGGMGGVRDMELVVKSWKQLAKHVIANKESPKPENITINYNSWNSDINYRKYISQKLMGMFNDVTLNIIPSFGKGSSFGELNITKITAKDIFLNWRKIFKFKRLMNIHHYIRRFISPKTSLNRNVFFERWKLLSNNQHFRNIFLDSEILELSEIIFGEIPETRQFVDSINKGY